MVLTKSMTVEFSGGLALLTLTEHGILMNAPEGVAKEMRARNWSVTTTQTVAQETGLTRIRRLLTLEPRRQLWRSWLFWPQSQCRQQLKLPQNPSSKISSQTCDKTNAENDDRGRDESPIRDVRQFLMVAER